MTRREFVWLAGGTAIAWPLLANAQQPTVPIAHIAYLGASSTRNHKSLRQRPLTRRWWTFDLVHTNGSASSL